MVCDQNMPESFVVGKSPGLVVLKSVYEIN